MPFPFDQLLKSQLEVFIKAGVKQRVDKGVGVAQPGEEVGHRRGGAEEPQAHQELLQEKGHPAKDEGPKDEAQDACRLPFPQGANLVPLIGRVQVCLEGWDADGDIEAVKLGGGVWGGEVGHAEGVHDAAVVERVLAVHAAAAEVSGRAALLVERLGGAEDPVVQDEDEGHWDVEGPKGGVDGVAYVVVLDDALAGHGGFVTMPPEERRQRDEHRDNPHHGHHDGGSPSGPLASVLDGLGDGPEAIQRNHAQVEDGGGATGHVHAQPYLTDRLAQCPRLHGDVHYTDRHHQDGHQEVGYGQRADEVVSWQVELLGGANGCDHRHIDQGRQESQDPEKDHHHQSLGYHGNPKYCSRRRISAVCGVEGRIRALPLVPLHLHVCPRLAVVPSWRRSTAVDKSSRLTAALKHKEDFKMNVSLLKDHKEI